MPFLTQQSPEKIASANAQAAALAQQNGTTPQQELDKWAQQNGYSGQDMGVLMGTWKPQAESGQNMIRQSDGSFVPQQSEADQYGAQKKSDYTVNPVTAGINQGSPQVQPSQNLGFGGSVPGQNPYLAQQAQGITQQMNDNWTRNQLPSIRSGAMAAGGFGGSRQGVVEANGLNDMNRSLGQNLTNLYGTDWTNQQNRNLQKQGLDNSYDLGLRSNDLGYANLDAGIANSNFNNQLAAANFGLGVYNTMNQQTQNGINAGTTIQNTPLDYQKYFTNSANGVGSGYSTGTSSQTNPGNPYMSAIGGAMMGNQLQNGTSQTPLYNQYTGAKL